jgi:hypothetical protein
MGIAIATRFVYLIMVALIDEGGIVKEVEEMECAR